MDRRRQRRDEAGERADGLGGDRVRLLRHRRGAAADAGPGLAALAPAHEDEVAGHLAERAGQSRAPAGEGAKRAAVAVPRRRVLEPELGRERGGNRRPVRRDRGVGSDGAAELDARAAAAPRRARSSRRSGSGWRQRATRRPKVIGAATWLRVRPAIGRSRQRTAACASVSARAASRASRIASTGLRRRTSAVSTMSWLVAPQCSHCPASGGSALRNAATSAGTGTPAGDRAVRERGGLGREAVEAARRSRPRLLPGSRRRRPRRAPVPARRRRARRPRRRRRSAPPPRRRRRAARAGPSRRG